MEELTKSQIVLLTLLVSFVTSIATGIVTVTLVDQAPPSVTETIHQVVERTIEKVTPAPAAPAPKQTPAQVVVKSEDLIEQAVARNAKSIARISRVGTDPDTGTQKLLYVGLGVFISSDGLLLADKGLFGAESKYAVTTDQGTFPLVVRDSKNGALFQTRASSSQSSFVNTALGGGSLDGSEGNSELVAAMVLLDPSVGTSSSGSAASKPPTFSAARFGDSDQLKLGQTVIALGGTEDRNTVGVGVISGIVTKPIATASSTAKTYRSMIETDLDARDNSSGFFMLNTAGELIGAHISRGETARNLYVPINLLRP